ncbi:hypothetical protein ABK040_004109 [Willaertia magna]
MNKCEEEKQLKKRKKVLEHYFTLEILFEITKCFSDPKDYVYLAQTCKYFYEVMLMKENYLFKLFNDILFGSVQLKLTSDLPDYFFKLNKLRLCPYGNDYNLLQKFTNLTTLHPINFPGKYLQNLPCLTDLKASDTYDIDENSFTNLKQLKVLSVFFIDELQDEWLKNLNNLKELTIYGCKNVTGNCLLNFTSLTYLDFRNCSINDETLLHCKNLTSISVFGCKSILGTCFKEFKELKYLNIGYCNITDNSLNNLNNLESLNIKGCKNIIGNCFQNLKQLKTLSIDVRNFQQLNYLNHLINLTNLDITIKINEKIENTSFLLKLVNLKCLSFESEDFVYRDADFYNLKNLQHLTINSRDEEAPGFTGRCFQYFTKLETLHCNINFTEKYLYYLTNIKYLCLKYFDECFHFNKKFTNLKRLEKVKLVAVQEIKLKSLQQLFLNIKYLKIYSSEITGDFCNMPNLTKLILKEVTITDKQLMNLQNLKELIITKSSCLITGECFLHLKQLQVLNICGCKEIGFKYLSHLKELTDLNVKETKIKDEDLEGLNNMKQLNITYCSDLVIGTFLLNMNKLRQLEFFDGKQPLDKIEIENLKKEIRNGKTFNDSINIILYHREL